MNTFKVPKSRCPHCGRELSRVTAFQHDASPKVGDLTVCVGCTEFLQFDAFLVPRAIDAVELRKLGPNVIAELHSARRLLQAVKSKVEL